MGADDLLAWAAGLPMWQQDALRRIAQTNSLHHDEIQEIRRNLYIAHGLMDGDSSRLCPLAGDDIPAEKAAGPRTILHSISDIRNANRLAEGQMLRFATDGITLIYGDNGSGKSGYCRIAKKLCRARATDTILGNIFADSPPARPQAKIKFQIEGSDIQETSWQDGQAAPDATSRISVFDSRSAALYVDQENRIEFLPERVEIVRQLGQVCTKLGEDIKKQISEQNQRIRTPLPHYPQKTAVASMIEKLNSNASMQQLPTEEVIKEYAVWTQDDDAELKELEQDLNRDPIILAEQRERCRLTCESLAREFDVIEAAVGEKAVSDLQSKHTVAAEARQAAQAAASDLPTELDHVGSDPWRKLFHYAKEYSALAYPGVTPLATREGDRCVLCQQTLSAEAAERLRGFEQFISGKASEEADERQRAYEEAMTAVERLVIPSDKSVEQRLSEYGEISPARKANQKAAITYVADLAHRKAALIKAAEDGDFDRVLSITLPKKPPLVDEASTLAVESASLRAAAVDTTERQKRIARRNELAARKQLSNELSLVIERRNDVERWQKLRSCEAATRTQGISVKITELRRNLVTAELEKRIRAEIETLGLGHIPFKVRDASSKADSTVQIALDGMLTAVNSRVLSEGEQRALALACFLADVAGVPSNDGIIVDDPVSSLDHIRMRTVARRLVKEATRRQVVIFTHNLSFFREVLDSAAEKQIPVITHWVQHNASQGFGVIYENEEPWFAKKVKSRIHSLKKKQTSLTSAKAQGDEAYRHALKDFFSDLRETWERLVEELLLYGVVERLCTDVKTQKLKGVYVEDTDYRTIYWQMKRASELSGHDMTVSKAIFLPNFEDVDNHIQTLEQYVEEVNTRRKKVEEQRKRLERAPDASFA